MTGTLRLGDHGNKVKALQTLLARYSPGLKPDAVFGPRTERATRLAQRRLGLFPPDGLAGPRTMQALARAARPPARAAEPSFADRVAAAANAVGSMLSNAEEAIRKEIASWSTAAAPAPKPIPPSLNRAVAPAKERAQHNDMPAGEVAPVATMTMSARGRQFVFRHEAGNGSKTGRLHHPSDGSGVTLGPGYDMKARSRAQVTTDLTRIGVPAATAAKAAEGAGLDSDDARDFASANHDLLNLTLAQQVQLQVNYKGHYEAKVRRAIKIPLHQYEFDALVSYAGNPGTNDGWLTTTRLVNERRPDAAMAEIKKYIYSKKSGRMQGLVNRRDAEARLFLYGEYSA